MGGGLGRLGSPGRFDGRGRRLLSHVLRPVEALHLLVRGDALLDDVAVHGPLLARHLLFFVQRQADERLLVETHALGRSCFGRGISWLVGQAIQSHHLAVQILQVGGALVVAGRVMGNQPGIQPQRFRRLVCFLQSMLGLGSAVSSALRGGGLSSVAVGGPGGDTRGRVRRSRQRQGQRWRRGSHARPIPRLG